MQKRTEKMNRILSLDIFRGLIIILMIIVNSPGNDSPYPILKHASWDGCTLADLVFPAFLFIVGMTIVVSLQKGMQHKTKTKTKQQLYKDILHRSIILFILGLVLNTLPNHFNLSTLRFYGVLQRIALCYLLGAFVYLNTSFKTQILLFLSILLGYWFWMTQISVPGLNLDLLSMEGSWAGYIDRMIFSAPHLYLKIHDPEGLLSTLPSLANTVAGIIAGRVLLSKINKNKVFYLLFFMGLSFLFLGALWNISFPLNKNLWTSSFVFWTVGWALVVFSLCFFIVDILGFTKWALPLKIFGMNALFAFVFHVIVLKVKSIFVYHLRNGQLATLKYVICDHLFGSFNLQNAALMYSLSFLLFNFIVVAVLYRNKIFIRI